MRGWILHAGDLAVGPDEQAYALLVLYVFAFLVPAFYVGLLTRREDPPGFWPWTIAVVVAGPLGLFAWWMDRRIRARKKAEGSYEDDRILPR